MGKLAWTRSRPGYWTCSAIDARVVRGATGWRVILAEKFYDMTRTLRAAIESAERKAGA